MKKDIIELFCWVDDFCKALDRHLSSHQLGPSRQPTRVPEMTLSEIVTSLKKSMKPKLMLIFEKMLLRKRGLIESVFHILKNIFEFEHTRHRSIANACVHLTSTLLAYCFKANKPKIKCDFLIQNRHGNRIEMIL